MPSSLSENIPKRAAGDQGARRYRPSLHLVPVPPRPYLPMMAISDMLWTAAMGAVRGALPLLARGEGKLARGVRGRQGVLERMRGWAERERDPSRPLAWFHAPSVGEGLQAFAVMDALRSRRPDVQLVYTFFSPSAEAFARRAPAELADYLPLDAAGDVEEALSLLRPDAVVFSKYDVWPTLVRLAKRRGARVALLSATLPESSSRLRVPARHLLRASYARLDAVAAISTGDAARFEALGVPAERRSVMGDARFDQVWRRAAAVDRESELLRPLRDGDVRTLVAGSTWPADEERLLEAWARLGTIPRRLVLVPHETTPAHLAATEALLARHRLSSVRLGEAAGRAPGAEVILVDRMGVLGDLYALADAAYVGGGWGSAGIHSVLEPAAYGAPVVFGPRHANAREAAGLAARGGGFSIASVDELTVRLRALLGNDTTRARAGRAAREYVRAETGAAERGAALVERLLDRATG